MSNTNDHIDLAFQAFETLLLDLPNFEKTIQSEADVRMKLIDEILTSVLGWEKQDILTEEPAGSGFLDYKLSTNGRARVVVEAKRASRPFNLDTLQSGHAYKLNGPTLTNQDLQEGIKQAIRYSSYKGTELACITNGYEWAIFRSNRSADGTDTLKGKSFIFGSLESVRDAFSTFYNLLAKERVALVSFRALFQEVEGRIIRHSNFQRSLRPPNSATFLPQADVIPELDRIMTSFFQRLTNERDKEMTELCFVETKESIAADQRLLRLAEELVGHIRTLDTSSGAELVDLIDRAKTMNLNQFILIVGTKGAGKSTFVERFFSSKLPNSLEKSVVPITVDLAGSDGDSDTVIEWLRRNLLAKAETALGGRVPTWDELIGHMFFSEYQRWSSSTMSNLYNSNKEEFKIRFGDHIEDIRRNRPLEYLSGLLRNFVKARQQLPCLIFDNADHFSIDFQEKVFQFARSLFEQELCIVIMPITDKTSWQLSNQGALNSFENEALLLPTPSAKQVLEKRINFVLSKIEEDDELDAHSQYFVGKGIRVDVSSIVKFVRGLQEVFLNTRKTTYLLGQLTNHNIRNVLELSRDLINSPHIGLDEAFKAYIVGSAINIPEYKTSKALIRGRYSTFVEGANLYIHNVFNLNIELETSPLVGMRILQALKDAIVRTGGTKNKYMSKDDLHGYMLAIGIENRVVTLWLDVLLKKMLVINYDPTCIDAETATQLEISPAGELHLYWARGSYEYLEAMAETTAIFNEEAFQSISIASEGYGKLRMKNIISAFIEYINAEDRLYCQVPDHESYRGQKNLLPIPHFS